MPCSAAHADLAVNDADDAVLLLQTFDFDKPGIMVGLEREACLSFYNHHFPERVCTFASCSRLFAKCT